LTTAYDLVPYPSTPIKEAHPTRLAVLAALFGLRFVPFHECRVLEIGCGEGVNLMSMAVTAPRSEFVGIDLAETAIAHGRDMARAAGLANVRLHAQDLLEAGPGLGQFDYIIAHGLYAWVPEPVRAAAMRLIGRSLGPDGLAYISYNAYPGCRLREVLRDILLEATRGLAEPGARLDAAHAALRRQIEMWSEADPMQHALIIEAREMLQQPPELLFHDSLGEAYAPQLLGAVVAAARAENLDYLCDVNPELSAEAFWPSEKFEAAAPFTGRDWARFEQLSDFAGMQFFRRSLLCRAGREIDRRMAAERFHGFWGCAAIERVNRELENPDEFEFRAGNGVEVATRDPRLADLLEQIGRAYPMSFPLDGVSTYPEVAELLLCLYVSQVVVLTTSPSPFVLTLAEKPVASPLARIQAGQGNRCLASLRHKPVYLEDAGNRAFLTLLDGTRTCGELARVMAEQSGMSVDAAAAGVPRALAEMARLGLMMQ